MVDYSDKINLINYQDLTEHIQAIIHFKRLIISIKDKLPTILMRYFNISRISWWWSKWDISGFPTNYDYKPDIVLIPGYTVTIYSPSHQCLKKIIISSCMHKLVGKRGKKIILHSPCHSKAHTTQLLWGGSWYPYSTSHTLWGTGSLWTNKQWCVQLTRVFIAVLCSHSILL